MTVFRLLAAFVARRPLTWAFHALVLAVAVAVMTTVVLVEQATRERLARDLAGIDLVVGAEGSALQLVMAAVLQADVPTGNIPLSVADGLARDRLVASAVPVSMGDSLGAARIVGTTRDYAGLYDADLRAGRWWSEPLEAVIGASVARDQGLAVGVTFVGAHGLDPGGDAHAGRPYRVVGVLAPTGAVIDRLILTDLSSVWALHEDEDHDDAQAHSDHEITEAQVDHERQVTAVLVRYRSPLAAVLLPRRIAALDGVQAASPPREAQRLNALVGDGAEAAGRLGLVLLGLSGLGFVLALTTAVMSRRRELALLKALGASPGRLAILVLLEGALLGAAGGLAGLMIGRAVMWAVSRSGTAPLDLPIAPAGAFDALVVAGAVLLGVAASLPAAAMAIRIDPVRTLGGGT